MDEKLYLIDLDCYARADEKQKKKVKESHCFDFGLLPTKGLQNEFRSFIENRSRQCALATMIQERVLYMFRHVYGIRLTELHLDDWTIAKLLGHTSVKNVKFYRKMSLQIIADETREIRAEMSRMIRANLAGWGKEYEQI